MKQSQAFISYLEEHREDRAVLAALRRGLGQPPGTVPDTYRYVVPWLADDTPPWREAAYYLVAALFAYHPAPGGVGNMGDHFARTRVPGWDDTATERRFIALLAANPDDLDLYLRQAVSFLKSKDVPVNWHQLLTDILDWGHPARYVQQQWARAYWRRSVEETQTSEEE